ncbi:FYVE, RhoGEF and PH domain-containing protein 6-like isoform X2 [Colossoma macropomum]|uniref:FYVE, RhoGEF and PH domain-containing protein 6-like isoform X2 n=1 Tax=Colossoma macropomum TaxID=42526 RepID=UPI0018651D98|nr:FYVE, RhoGEF and PH domain-containing protein 6-like isoform X2 [Colossoma macropomum]
MERTGLATGVEKPIVAPKPKVVPPPKPILHPATKHAPNLEFSQPLKSAVKPAVAPKPSLFKTSASPLEPKPLVANTEYQQKSEITRHVGLLNSRNGPFSELKKPEWDYVIPICVCAKGKCDECSPKENNRRPVQHGKCAGPCVNNKPEGTRTPTPRALTKPQHVTEANRGQAMTPSVKDFVQGSSSDQPRQTRVIHGQSPVQNLTVANGLAGSERHATEKPQSSADGAHVPPATVIGSPPKLSEQALTNSTQHGHVPGKQNGSLPSVVAPVRKPLPPLPAPRKPKNISDMTSEDSQGSAKTRLNVVNLKQNTPVLPHKGRTPITPLKPPTSEKKSTRGVAETQCDNVDYPHWRSPSSEQTQDQDVHHHGLSEDAAVHKNQQPTSRNLSKQPKPKTIIATEVHQTPQRNKETMPEKEILQSNNKHVECSLPVPAERKLGGKASQKMMPHSGKQEPSDSTPENAPAKRSGTNLKPKAKSFSPADMLQKNTSRQKIMDVDLPVKKAKGKQALNCTSGKDEQSVEEDWQDNRNQNGTHIQIPEYRTHLLTVHSKEPVSKFGSSCQSYAKEQSVDEDDVLGEAEYDHLYEDIPDYVDTFPPTSPGIQTQQQSKIQHRYGLYEILSVPGECTDSSKRNVYEEMASSDDSHSEEEIDSGSEEEEDIGSYSEKGRSQDDAKRTKLAHIAKEIMSSEKVFVDVLKLLHITFRDAVAKASSQAGKAVIEERILMQILYMLPQLYELNCNLLSELENRVANWNEHSTVADIFLKKGPYLKMYSAYICEFDKNVTLLEEQCKKNPAFAKVVREFESSPCCANLAVKHYMLKPVQRLPQYQLLLSDYLKNLNENSPDYKDTQAALKLVKDVASHANETMRQGDNFQKLMQVQCSLAGHHEIVLPGRVFLKEGTLMKLSRKDMQPRTFFLFNDMLLYTTPLQSGQYKLNKVLSLAGMKVSKPSQEGYQNELNIESVERSFILSASSPAIRDSWLEAISTAIDNYTKKMISFSSTKSQEEGDKEGLDTAAQLGSKAPIWIPDLRATMCLICTCEFTLTWRRHHCRACGKVVCQACSTHKYPLEYLKNQPARVCDQCFEILQHNSSGNGVVSPNSKPGGFHLRKQKKIPAALKEVSANTDESSMSGYLERMKANKKQWKKLWFVIKNKVLYTYAASEDIVALESLPLLGFSLLEEESESSQQFRLYHKKKLFYIFKTDDTHIYHRWIEAFHEATVL